MPLQQGSTCSAATSLRNALWIWRFRAIVPPCQWIALTHFKIVVIVPL